MIAATEWVECSWCLEEWPADAFSAAGTAFRETSRKVCNACFTEAYPARVIECSGCGARIKTRGTSETATCRSCRAHIKAGTPIPPATCASCKKDLRGRVRRGEVCVICYQREWRAKHEVTGKRTLGAWKQDRAA